MAAARSATADSQSTHWLGIGTDYAAGGAIGKVALLAQVTGYDPRSFGGHDLIAALAEVTCTKTDLQAGCAGAGNYRYATSVFGQSLGIMAQRRAGQGEAAAKPVDFLKGLQRADGSFPSLIPAGDADKDVDSTAMAAMALAPLTGDPAAVSAVDKALTWIASTQKEHGGFPGAAGDSTNSTALAIQGLTLRGEHLRADRSPRRCRSWPASRTTTAASPSPPAARPAPTCARPPRSSAARQASRSPP